MSNKSVVKYIIFFIGGPRDGATDEIKEKRNFLYAGRVEDGFWDTWAKGHARYELSRIRGEELYFTFVDYQSS